MEEWLERSGYLPPFMRDFHDQKLLFQRVDEVVQRKRDEGGMLAKDLPDWISAHIYVVDFFLRNTELEAEVNKLKEAK
jgi:hypothetical protein